MDISNDGFVSEQEADKSRDTRFLKEKSRTNDPEGIEKIEMVIERGNNCL